MKSKSILFLCSFLPSILFALTTDTKDSIIIQSDSAEMNRQTGINAYLGNVKIDQSTTHIRGDKVTAHVNKQNKIEKIIIEGHLAHTWVQPDTNTSEMHARAKIIHYYPKTKQLLLQGQAEIQQDKNILRGETIQYNLQNQHVVSKAQPGKRTMIIMSSKQ